MTHVTIIDNPDYHYYNNKKVTRVSYNVWPDDGYRNPIFGIYNFSGHLNRQLMTEIISTHFLTSDEYFEQFGKKLDKEWAFEKYGFQIGYDDEE